MVLQQVAVATCSVLLLRQEYLDLGLDLDLHNSRHRHRYRQDVLVEIESSICEDRRLLP
jgi:hypothetical protein